MEQADREETFTLATVSSHCTRDDCWVIVHGRVYDVTEFVPRHPGGSLIYLSAGRDCSNLFESYHKLATRKVLSKYCIGSLESGQVTPHYEEEGEDDVFYMTLKGRVEKYFRDNDVDPKFSISLYIKSALLLASKAAFAYWAFFAVGTSYSVALASAAAMGCTMALVGICIQHDANHGAFARSPWVCWLMGLTLELNGASCFLWKQQHQVGHHIFTNVSSLDPDVRCTDDGSPGAFRFTRWQPRRAVHAFQHLYLGFLYGLLAANTIFVGDYSSLAAGRIGAVKLPLMSWRDKVQFVLGKLTFLVWYFCLPLCASHRGVRELVGLWVVGLLFTGWVLAFSFQVAHAVEAASTIEIDPATQRLPGGWAAHQVATSADFAHGSWFWTHLLGGLNYQVVHHLFPGVAHPHYPAIAPLVVATAKEFGVAYAVYPSFWAALWSHFSYLRTVGRAPRSFIVGVPSLNSIG